jgi:ABC-type nickel/cobalt efflux system permease component RcnA
MRLIVLLCLVTVLIGSGAGEIALADSGEVREPSAWSQMMSWVWMQQRAFHQELTSAFRQLADTGEATAALFLIGASFLYGVFHAVGPGHGKVVLATYLATHSERLGRGVGLAIAASVCQGLVAIGIIYGFLALADGLTLDSRSAVKTSERLSFLLLIVLGCVLAVRSGVTGYRRLRRGKAGLQTGADHSSGEVHGTDHHAGCGHGHNHLPTETQLKGASTLRARVGVILSIGLRPCTGAVIVLVFAQAIGLFWAGIAAVAAMSAGTAMAVALLAFIVINARSFAGSLVGGRTSVWSVVSAEALAMVGGIILAGIGISLFRVSMAPPHPLGL